MDPKNDNIWVPCDKIEYVKSRSWPSDNKIVSDVVTGTNDIKIRSIKLFDIMIFKLFYLGILLMADFFS